jgi:hypothetical protein
MYTLTENRHAKKETNMVLTFWFLLLVHLIYHRVGFAVFTFPEKKQDIVFVALQLLEATITRSLP